MNELRRISSRVDRVDDEGNWPRGNGIRKLKVGIGADASWNRADKDLCGRRILNTAPD
jgi:hypothetical protein